MTVPGQSSIQRDLCQIMTVVCPGHALLSEAHLPCRLCRPSAVSSARRVPTVGVLNVDGACGCSSVPDKKPPPISVPASNSPGRLNARRVSSSARLQ